MHGIIRQHKCGRHPRARYGFGVRSWRDGAFAEEKVNPAALTTLIVGCCLGAMRLATDILSKMGYADFGPLNILTGFSFLNYSVIMFFICVLLMIVLSFLTARPGEEKVANLTFSAGTMSQGVNKVWVVIHAILSILVAGIIITIWAHFA